MADDFISLTCPSCGGKLQITPDLERFACAYCGAEHIVRRGGGVVSLQPVTEAIGKVQAGVDRTASELAIKRLQEEIGALEQTKLAMYPTWDGLIYFSAWGAGALAAFSLLFAWLAEWDSSIICLTVVLILITLGLVVYKNDLHQTYRRKIAPVQEQIDRRLAEIQRHRQVVSTQTDS